MVKQYWTIKHICVTTTTNINEFHQLQQGQGGNEDQNIDEKIVSSNNAMSSPRAVQNIVLQTSQ